MIKQNIEFVNFLVLTKYIKRVGKGLSCNALSEV